jgi:small-conductance mechanosensitive channel
MQEQTILLPFEKVWQKTIDFLPSFIAAAVLIIVGVVLAWGVRFLVIKILNSIGWEKVSKKISYLRLLEIGDIRYPLFDFLGTIAFWIVILVFCSTAAQALGLTAIERMLEQFVSYLPNLFIAALILGLGIWLGILAGRFTRAFGISAQLQEANLLGKGIQYLIIIIAAGTALEQLHVGTRFLFGAFLIMLGALGLAFGLGGREKAREIIERISNTEKK